MNTASLLKNISYQNDKPTVAVMLESDFSKEIRITFASGQVMKKHKTPYPIVVQVVHGHIDFGVDGKMLHLKSGDLIALAGGVPHDLTALENSIVRLTLSKLDSSERVKNIAK